MLHMPMQPVGTADPGAEAIRPMDTPAQIVQKLETAHAAVPMAKGINNHMGSAASNDPEIMRAVLNWTRAQGLFYVDSATAALNACTLAPPGLACGRNAVFLDHGDSVASVGKAIKKARRLSARTGKPIIMIGHPHPRTIAVLRAFIQLKPDEFVSIEQVLDSVASGPWPVPASER